jgi:hypothetical protein
MTVANVRAAIASWLAPPAVTNLNTMFRAEPRVIVGRDFVGPVGVEDLSGGVGFLHFGDSFEQRIADGGAHDGWKAVLHTVTIQLWFRSTETDFEVASDDLDLMRDTLISRIRADRNFGTWLDGTINPVIWSAGEGGIENSGTEPDLRWRQDLPFTYKTAWWTAAALDMTVVEMVET